MKILIISFRYPPHKSIGANRIYAFVEFLKKHNVEYRVITSFAGKHSNSELIEDPNVTYVSWFNFRKFKTINFNKFQQGSESKQSINLPIQRSPFSGVKQVLNSFLDRLLLPDPYITWVFNAISKRSKILNGFQPDIIYSSSYPYSAHIIAKNYKQKLRTNWVCELRDPWVNNHVTSGKSKWRDFMDYRISKKIFKTVDRFVTVSDVWKADLESMYLKSCWLVRNGFTDSSFTSSISENIRNLFLQSSRKRIVYLGSIFPEHQNIHAFLDAFLDPDSGLNDFDFVYFGGNGKLIEEYIAKRGYDSARVFIFESVPHSQALELQKIADFLLLFNWKGKSKGIIPGKFYEYVGANSAIVLWNEGIDNELLSLCTYYSKESGGNKAIIIDRPNEFNWLIKNFVYNNNRDVINKFHRDFQFNFLLDNLKSLSED